MIIQHNLPAINAHRQMGINNSAISKSLEKLSSGYAINRAADNAAGLAISEKMRGQISGLNQASKNAQDGISLIQTAEGALNETHSILQRMRELSVQSANGTYQDAVDRENIQKEVDNLKSEINRISTSTHFNNTQLLDGSLGRVDPNSEAEVLDKAMTKRVNAVNISQAQYSDADALKTGVTLDVNTNNPLRTVGAANSVTGAAKTAAQTAAATGVANSKASQELSFKFGTAADAGVIAFDTAATAANASAAMNDSIVNNNVAIKFDDFTVRFTTSADAAGLNDKGDVLTVDISSVVAAGKTVKDYNTALVAKVSSAINSTSSTTGFSASNTTAAADDKLYVSSNTAAANDFQVGVKAGKKEAIVMDFADYDPVTTDVGTKGTMTKQIMQGDKVTIDGKTYEFTDDDGAIAKGNIAVKVGNGVPLSEATNDELIAALENAINTQYAADNPNHIRVVADTTAHTLTIFADDGAIGNRPDSEITATKNFTNDESGKNYTTTFDLAGKIPGVAGENVALNVNGIDYEFQIGADDAATATNLHDAVVAKITAQAVAGGTADFSIADIDPANPTKITLTSNTNTHATASVKVSDTNYTTDYTIDANKLKNHDTFTYAGVTIELIDDPATDTVTKGNVALSLRDANASTITDLFKRTLAEQGTAESSLTAARISETAGKITVQTDKNGTQLKTSSTVIATVKQAEGIVFQIGANGTEDQRVNLFVEAMGSDSIGTQTAKIVDGAELTDEHGNVIMEVKDENSIKGISVGTRDKANSAIKIIDDAINQVSGTRADLGALQNRLEHTINSLGVASENLTAAESRIRDVDMAKEMMSFTKNQILSQASQAMLAQANSLPQGVLQLLQ